MLGRQLTRMARSHSPGRFVTLEAGHRDHRLSAHELCWQALMEKARIKLDHCPAQASRRVWTGKRPGAKDRLLPPCHKSARLTAGRPQADHELRQTAVVPPASWSCSSCWHSCGRIPDLAWQPQACPLSPGPSQLLFPSGHRSPSGCLG